MDCAYISSVSSAGLIEFPGPISSILICGWPGSTIVGDGLDITNLAAPNSNRTIVRGGRVLCIAPVRSVHIPDRVRSVRGARNQHVVTIRELSDTTAHRPFTMVTCVAYTCLQRYVYPIMRAESPFICTCILAYTVTCRIQPGLCILAFVPFWSLIRIYERVLPRL
jgi:hypothetical protein